MPPGASGGSGGVPMSSPTQQHSPRRQVLIGLPTYSGDSLWFHSSAENMRTGLQGVVAGLNSNRDTSAFTGVAIYRFASTGNTDWTTYDKLWLGAS